MTGGPSGIRSIEVFRKGNNGGDRKRLHHEEPGRTSRNRKGGGVDRRSGNEVGLLAEDRPSARIGGRIVRAPARIPVLLLAW